MIVSHYGVHTDDDGYRWVLQGRGQALSPVGLPSEACPLEIRSRMLGCPHNFNFSSAASKDEISFFKSILEKSKILKFLAPSGEELTQRVMYIETTKLNDIMTLATLMHFACPIRSITYDISDLKGPEAQASVFRNVNNSNLGRSLVSGVRMNNMRHVEQIVSKMIAAPGRLLIAGERMPFYGLDQMMKVVPFEERLGKFSQLYDVASIRRIGSVILREELMV